MRGKRGSKTKVVSSPAEEQGLLYDENQQEDAEPSSLVVHVAGRQIEAVQKDHATSGRGKKARSRHRKQMQEPKGTLMPQLDGARPNKTPERARPAPSGISNLFTSPTSIGSPGWLSPSHPPLFQPSPGRLLGSSPARTVDLATMLLQSPLRAGADLNPLDLRFGNETPTSKQPLDTFFSPSNRRTSASRSRRRAVSFEAEGWEPTGHDKQPVLGGEDMDHLAPGHSEDLELGLDLDVVRGLLQSPPPKETPRRSSRTSAAVAASTAIQITPGYPQRQQRRRCLDFSNAESRLNPLRSNSAMQQQQQQQRNGNSNTTHADDAAAGPSALDSWIPGSCAAMAQQLAASGQLELEPLVMPHLPVGLPTGLGDHGGEEAAGLRQLLGPEGLHQGLAAEGPLAPVVTLMGSHEPLSDAAAFTTAAASCEQTGGRRAAAAASQGLLSPISKQLLTPVSRHLAGHHHAEEGEDEAEQEIGFVALLAGLGSPSHGWQLRSSSRRHSAATVPAKTASSRLRVSALKMQEKVNEESEDEDAAMEHREGYQLRHRRTLMSSQSKPANVRRTRRQLLQEQHVPYQEQEEEVVEVAQPDEEEQQQQRDRSRSRPSSRSSGRRGEWLGVESTVVQQAVASAALQAAAAGRRPHVPTPFALDDSVASEGRRRMKEQSRQRQRHVSKQEQAEQEEQTELEDHEQQVHAHVLRARPTNGSDAEQVGEECSTKPSPSTGEQRRVAQDSRQEPERQQQQQRHERSQTPQHFFSSSSGWKDGRGVAMGSMVLQAGRPLQLLREPPGHPQPALLPPETVQEYETPRHAITKRCHCKKSQCLKLYCECFAGGLFCNGCSCHDCKNHASNGEEVLARRGQIKQRDPDAFTHKLRPDQQMARKGCNCRKSHCLKKYCECYQMGVRCGDMCKCLDCKNTEIDGSVVKQSSSTPSDVRLQHTTSLWQMYPEGTAGTPPVRQVEVPLDRTPQGHLQVAHGPGGQPMLVRLASMPNTPAGSGPMVILPLKSPTGLMPAPTAQLALVPGLSGTPDAKGRARLGPTATGVPLVPTARQQLFKAPGHAAAAVHSAVGAGQGGPGEAPQFMLQYVGLPVAGDQLDRRAYDYAPPPVHIKREAGVQDGTRTGTQPQQHTQQQQLVSSVPGPKDPPQPTRASHVHSWHPHMHQQQQQQHLNSNLDLSCLEPGFEAESPDNKDPELQLCMEPQGLTAAAGPPLLEVSSSMYVTRRSSTPANLATPDQQPPEHPSCTPSSHGSCQEAALAAAALPSSGTATPRAITEGTVAAADAPAVGGDGEDLGQVGKEAGQGLAGKAAAAAAAGGGGGRATGAVTRSRHRLSATSSCPAEEGTGDKVATAAAPEAGAAAQEGAPAGRTHATRAATRAAAAAAGGGGAEKHVMSSSKPKRQAAAAGHGCSDDGELGSQPLTGDAVEGFGTQESSADAVANTGVSSHQQQQQVAMSPPAKSSLMLPPHARQGGGGARALIGTGSKQLPVEGTPEVLCPGVASSLYHGSSSRGLGQQEVGRVGQGLATPAASSSQGDASAATAAAAQSIAAALAARQQHQQEAAAAGNAAASEEVGVIVHMQDETGAITSYFVSNTAMQAASASGHSSSEIVNLMAQGGCLSQVAPAGVNEGRERALQAMALPAEVGRLAGEQQEGRRAVDLTMPMARHGSAVEDGDVVMADAEGSAADAATGDEAVGFRWAQGSGVRREVGGSTPVRSTPVKRKMTPDDLLCTDQYLDSPAKVAHQQHHSPACQRQQQQQQASETPNTTQRVRHGPLFPPQVRQTPQSSPVPSAPLPQQTAPLPQQHPVQPARQHHVPPPPMPPAAGYPYPAAAVGTEPLLLAHPGVGGMPGAGAVPAAGFGQQQLGFVLAQTPQGLVLLPASALCGGSLAGLVGPHAVGLVPAVQQPEQQVVMPVAPQVPSELGWQQQQLLAIAQAQGRQQHQQQQQPGLTSHGQTLGRWQGQQQQQQPPLSAGRALNPGNSPCADKSRLSPGVQVMSPGPRGSPSEGGNRSSLRRISPGSTRLVPSASPS